VESSGTKLRDYLYDRELTKRKGNLLFCCLIEGVLSLQEKDWVVRSMWPNDIAVREEEGTVCFTNIVYMCEEYKEDNFCTAVPSPYSPMGMHEMNCLKSSDITTDHWAAGMIMLEVLIGSKIVLGLVEFNDIKWLLATIHNYIDPETHLMITWLMERSINFNPKTT
jgi:hypothetical protein